MMKNRTNDGLWIPVMSSKAGGCMTSASFHAAGVGTLSLHLASLLMKPGYSFLMSLSRLATYVAWSGKIVLNASLPYCADADDYRIVSTYDGQRFCYSKADILALITHLQPDTVILPEGVQQGAPMRWGSLQESIAVFLPESDLPDATVTRPYGVSITYDENTLSIQALIEQLEQVNHKPCCIVGDVSLSAIWALTSHSVAFVESDRPLQDALLGNVYSADGVFSVLNEACRYAFLPIDASCSCTTCQQALTRAYVHHLLQHTPLLCQRLLAHHKAHYCQSLIPSFTKD